MIQFGISRTLAGLGAVLLLGAPTALGQANGGLRVDPEAHVGPRPKNAGMVQPTALAAGLMQTSAAVGAAALENGTSVIPFYGYCGNGPMMPAPGDVQTPSHNVEASKTEPDKNTYLVLEGQTGPSDTYDYGTRFLFQGHELTCPDPVSGKKLGYITRINLDADAVHRVTLMASADRAGNPLPAIDGSTWDPFAQRLLFTSEAGANGGVWAATLDYPSTVDDLSGIFGRGGYEGIQNDSDGNLWIIEDVGGAGGAVNSHAKQPNSYVYRFLPNDKTDLTKGGSLQVLQVRNSSNLPILFHAGQADADILSPDVKDLHTYGKRFTTMWITIHDTANGTSPFDANALAKPVGTPFKRPENGLFRPGRAFTQFFFDETGDTNLLTEAGSAYGGFGSIMLLRQAHPSDDLGTLSLFYLGDAAHTGLDNVAFWDADHIVFVEDAGDTLHSQRNALDSAYLFDVTENYGDPDTPPPTRLLAEGRDASATLDSGFLAVSGSGFQNEGDNEITGFHVSNGDASVGGILGTLVPKPFTSGWRVFYTQQHGDNVTWEILSATASNSSSEFSPSRTVSLGR